jgi:hypothetical protein
VPPLIQLANQVTPVGANSLPNLIGIVTPAQIANLVASGLIPASGAANIPLLVPMIQFIGGHARIPTLAAMLIARGRQANHAFDLARAAAGNGAVFARLCGELPHFQRAAAPGVPPGPVNAARVAYNVARGAAPLNQLNALHLAAVAVHAAATAAGGFAPGLLLALHNRTATVHADIAAGVPNRNHAQQLNTIIAGALNNQFGVLGVAVPPGVANAANAFAAFDAASNAPDITSISYSHFLTRHTAHHFNFAEIKPDNTQWPTAWAAGASAQVEAQLVAVLAALHGAGDWLMPGVPKPGQAVAGGTAQIAGMLDGAGPGLRLGQFFPEAGATFFDHDAATMRGIDQLV